MIADQPLFDVRGHVGDIIHFTIPPASLLIVKFIKDYLANIPECMAFWAGMLE